MSGPINYVSEQNEAVNEVQDISEEFSDVGERIMRRVRSLRQMKP